MTEWRRAMIVAGGIAASLGAVFFLLRPAPSDTEAPRTHERAAASRRVRARLQQLRVDHPDWGDPRGEMRLQPVPPVTPHGDPAGSRPTPPGRPPQADSTRESGPDTAVDTPLDEEQEDVPTLRKIALEDPDPDRRLAAITLLGASEDPEAISALAQALSDQNEEVRMAALEALSDFTTEPPVDAIEDALRDPSPDIRFEALSVLADVAGEHARKAVEKALHDPDKDVRALAEGILDLENLSPSTPAQQQPAK